MRVAVVSYHTCPLEIPGSGDAGGMNVFVRELALGLATAGVRTDIFTRRASEDAPEVVIAGPGVRVFHVEAGPPRPVGRREAYSHLGGFEQRVAELARRCARSYDVVHSHYWMSGLVGKELAAAWSVPHVQTFHTLHAMKNGGERFVSEALASVRSLSEAFLAHSSELVTVGSEAERRALCDVLGVPPDKTKLVRPGYDPALFGRSAKHRSAEVLKRLAAKAPGLERVLEGRCKLVVAAGRIHPLKRFDLVLEGVELLRRTHPRIGDVAVVVCGGPSGESGEAELARLRSLVASSRRPELTLLAGPLPPVELAGLLAAAHVLVVTSLSESFGLVALEAAAVGTPAVATRSGGIEDVVIDGVTGVLVDRWSAKAVAEGIAALLADDTARISLGARAAEHVAPMTWKASTRSLLGVYAEALGRSTVAAAARK